MKRRSYLTIASPTVLGLAGCLARTPSVGSPTPDDAPLVRSGPGDYPHPIYVHNASEEAVTLTLTVERGGMRIYRERHTVDAGAAGVVAGITRRSLPVDDRRLTITAALADGQSGRVEVDIDDCLGSVDFSIDEAGELLSTYSIC